MVKKARGRPTGSSQHKAVDEPVLKKAGLLLLMGQVRNPTQAFRSVLGDADDVIIRRLQRKWLREGERIMKELQAPLWAQRWERDAAAFEQAAPDVFAKIKAFAESDGGAPILAEMLRGRPQSQMMALGVIQLWELVQEHSPVGAVAADRSFTVLLAGWSRFGSVPDAAFMRRIAERCLERAEQIEKRDEADPASNESNRGGLA